MDDHSFSRLLPFLLKITPIIYIPFERGDFEEYFKIKKLNFEFFFQFFDFPTSSNERDRQGARGPEFWCPNWDLPCKNEQKKKKKKKRKPSDGNFPTFLNDSLIFNRSFD